MVKEEEEEEKGGGYLARTDGLSRTLEFRQRV